MRKPFKIVITCIAVLVAGFLALMAVDSCSMLVKGRNIEAIITNQGNPAFRRTGARPFTATITDPAAYRGRAFEFTPIIMPHRLGDKVQGLFNPENNQGEVGARAVMGIRAAFYTLSTAILAGLLISKRLRSIAAKGLEKAFLATRKNTPRS